MEPKQFYRRAMAVVALLALMITGMGITLYDLQINNGQTYYEQSQKKIAEQQTVEAARGQLLDRNGQVLVSNRVTYQVTLDTSSMGDIQERNAILLSLIQIAREENVTWSDTLPISKTEPFVFTTQSPYFTVSQNEDGTENRRLTRLGELAVYQGWLAEDPTKEAAPEDEQPSEEPGFFEKIKRFFTGSNEQDQVPDQPKKPYHPPTAAELLGSMCRSFQIRGEGAVDEKAAETAGEYIPTLNIGDMSSEDARAVAGVMFELNYRARIRNWPLYVFAKDVDIDFISRVKERDLPGVMIEPTTVRQYNTPYAAHILGRVGAIDNWDQYKSKDLDGDGVPDYQMNDTVGKEGAELAFESYLRGSSGSRTVERNTAGKVVSETWIEDPKPGNNVMLTLDIGLQAYVENTLATAIPKIDTEEEVGGGACVILDVDTSEVLASASYPTFDLSTYAEDLAENSEDPLQPLYNRALLGTFAPGSTFKMITAIAGLEEGLITPSTEIRDEGIYKYYTSPQPRCWIYNTTGGNHGSIDVSEAIKVSCNYFFYDVGRRLGIDVLDDYASRFGLGQKTGIELAESQGVMASPAYTESMGGTWYEGATLSVAIGQESTQVTPIQLANYIATLVNGGTRNSTHLLKEVKSSDFSQVLYTQQPQALSTIEIRDENLEAVKAGMLALTTDGSVSRHFAGLPFKVGAKTGSAQVNGQVEANAVFVCFAPYEDPEVAMALVVQRGGSGSELGAMAADILSYYFSSRETRDELPTENTLIR